MFWTSNVYFFIKQNWICTMTRHHANNILLARSLPFDSDVRQRSYTLMIPLHCLWVKSINRTRGQFEYEVTFFFSFAWFRSFTCTGQLLFHSLRTFSSYANKTGWLQNEPKKHLFKENISWYIWITAHIRI